MMLLEAKYYSHHGKSMCMTKDVIKGFSWAAIQQCDACGESFHAHGQHKYHNAQCKRNIVKARSCLFCGCSFVPNFNPGKYCSENCQRWGVPYGSMAERDAMADKAYDLCINQGMSRKEAYGKMGISNTSLRALLEYRCGPNVWQWMEDRQKSISPSGFKGEGRKGRKQTTAIELSIKNSDTRNDTAKALKMWRLGVPTTSLGAVLGVSPLSVSGVLLFRSNGYKSKSAKRRNLSGWLESETEKNFRSHKYKTEALFRDALVVAFNEGGYNAQPERPVTKNSRQKVDIFVELMGSLYAVEAKNTGRSSRADQCLGQALRKGANIGALPVVAFPSDIRLSLEYLDGLVCLVASGVDVRLCNELDACSVLSMNKSEWIAYCNSGILYNQWSTAEHRVAEFRRRKSSALKVSRKCARCGHVFVSYLSTGKRRYCSKSCKSMKAVTL